MGNWKIVNEKLVMKHEDVAQLIELMRNLQKKKDGLKSP